MKRNVAAWMIVGVAGASAFLVPLSAGAEEKVKAGESVHVFDDPSFAAEHGQVTFSHLEHKEMFGQEKLDCKPCHMTKPPLYSMKKKEGEPHVVVTMAEMATGLSCGGCHNGKTAINGKVAHSVTAEDGCAKCHVK